MKILWICPFFPYPPDNGSRIRGYFITRDFFGSKFHTFFIFVVNNHFHVHQINNTNKVVFFANR